MVRLANIASVDIYAGIECASLDRRAVAGGKADLRDLMDLVDLMDGGVRGRG